MEKVLKKKNHIKYSMMRIMVFGQFREHCDENFFDQVYECIYSYCRKDKNFYIKESNNPHSDEKRVVMGINNGATGISYKIKQNGTTIEVICIYLA